MYPTMFRCEKKEKHRNQDTKGRDVTMNGKCPKRKPKDALLEYGCDLVDQLQSPLNVFIGRRCAYLRADSANAGTIFAPKHSRQLHMPLRNKTVTLAPFNKGYKVPNEIWMYTFELHCQSDWLRTCGTLQPPVVLTQVCSVWRQIALSMPKLWSDVHVGNRTHLAKTWLERAGNIPRTLDSCTGQNCRLSYRRPEEILDIICSFPFRKLHLSNFDVEHIDFEKVPKESLLLLEDLAIKSACYVGTNVTSLDPFRCPNLLVLDIHSMNIPRFNVPNPFAMWKKLRVLRLEGLLRVSECLDILNSASSVEECTMHPRCDSFNYAPSIVHTNLKILTLCVLSIPDISAFLDGFELPNLHTLILIPSFNPWDLHLPSLLCLIQRIGSLRSLNLRGLNRTFDIDLVLEFLPLLQVLELDCETFTTKTGERIGKGELGRCLRELHDCDSRNLYKLIGVCELRRNITQSQLDTSPTAVARLEKVSVRYPVRYPKKPAALSDDGNSRVRNLLDDGIEFKVFEDTVEYRSMRYCS